MPRHAPDDFSFLPSVDSTDDEVVERLAVWEAKQTMGHGEAPVPAFEPEPPPPPPRRQDFAEHRQSHVARAPAEPEMPRHDEPDVSHAPAVPLSRLPALPKDEDEAPRPVPRTPEVVRLSKERQSQTIATPPVSLGSLRPPKAEPPVAPKHKAETSSAPPPSTPDFKALVQASKAAAAAVAEEPDDPDVAKRKRWRKLAEKIGINSLGWSFGVHMFLLLIAAFIGVRQVTDKQVDFLPGGSSPQAQAAAAELNNTVQQKKNPWLKTKPQARKITVQSVTTNIVLPEMPPMDLMDFSKITSRMDISKAASMGAGQPAGMGMGGAGGGFGAGIGRGGKFTFVGQTALGKHVVFVVDVSGSMSAIAPGEKISRFDLLKKELVKTINLMPMGTLYEILFFSDFAWPHDQVDSRNNDMLMKYKWEIDSKDYKKVKIPTFRYIQATPFSLKESAEIVQRSENPGGTNWGSGLLMALNASPKPDVIFFMTDGLRSDEQGWIDVVTAENKRRLPVTAIYTSAMQQPDAAPELDSLAKRNNGRFTVVLGDGKIVKGEDFFKGKR